MYNLIIYSVVLSAWKHQDLQYIKFGELTEYWYPSLFYHVYQFYCNQFILSEIYIWYIITHKNEFETHVQ